MKIFLKVVKGIFVNGVGHLDGELANTYESTLAFEQYYREYWRQFNRRKKQESGVKSQNFTYQNTCVFIRKTRVLRINSDTRVVDFGFFLKYFSKTLQLTIFEEFFISIRKIFLTLAHLRNSSTYRPLILENLRVNLIYKFYNFLKQHDDLFLVFPYNPSHSLHCVIVKISATNRVRTLVILTNQARFLFPKSEIPIGSLRKDFGFSIPKIPY